MQKLRILSGFSTLATVFAIGLTPACSDDDAEDDSPQQPVAGNTGSGGARAGSGGAGGMATAGRPSGGSSSSTAGASSGGPGTAGQTGESGAGGSGGAQDVASVRVLHLSPDAPGVDVFVNDGATPAVKALAFGKGTGYLEVPPGAYDFDVAASGSAIEDAVLSIDDLDLAGGRSYTAVAYGKLESIEALALEDDYAGLADGSIRVRAIHAAAGVGEVDIWNITNPGDPSPLYEDVEFGQAGDALDVPAGAYTVGIDVDDDAEPDLAFALPSLEAGAVVNLFAVAEDESVFLLAQLPDGTTARIDPTGPTAYLRVVHLSPDAPAVDVFADRAAQPVVSGLAFSEASPYLALPATSYDIDVAAAGQGAGKAVLSVSDLSLGAGNFYTAVALGDLADIAALPLMDNYASLDEERVRLRAVHAAREVGEVDIWNIPATGAPAPLWENVEFGQAGESIDVAAGSYTVGVDVDDDAVPDLTFNLPELEAGTFATVFATNDSAGEVFLLALLRDGTTVRVDPE